MLQTVLIVLLRSADDYGRHEVQFDTVQPVCSGFVLNVDKGVSIEQYGCQLRHLDPDGTKTSLKMEILVIL